MSCTDCTCAKACTSPSELTRASQQAKQMKVIPTQRVTVNTAYKAAYKPLKGVCPIATKVANKIIGRSDFGYTKYGVTADRDDLTLDQWLTHAQEEAMDFAIYLEKIKKELNERGIV